MRPIVFGFTLAALLFVLSQAPRDLTAHNDADPGHGSGTHYAHCVTDGHHSRWPYVNYSEQFRYITSRFDPGVPNAYKNNVFIYAAVYWNAQGTRVIHTPGTQGTNLWATYSLPDGAYGYSETLCNHGTPLHQTTVNSVNLNRFYLDGLSLQVKRETALHELGHQMSLGHSNQFIEYPIAVMYRFGVNPPYQSPQPDDVCGVNAIYRSSTYPVSVPPCHADHFITP